MSLFSGDCQELAPCAVPVQHLGTIRSYGSSTSTATTTLTAPSTTTAALVHPPHPHQGSRRSSTATAVENAEDETTGTADCCTRGGGGGGGGGSGGEGRSEQRLETDDGERTANGEGGKSPDCTQGEVGGGEETKITPVPSSVTRVFKKCASNGSLALYVGTRTVTIDGTHLEPLKGIIVLDKESLQQTVSDNFRIWGQITLTFRYGREDEEVLGLRFCNEAILALKQLWPPLPRDPEEDDSEDEQLTPLQGVLLDRVNCSANSPSIHSVPFTLCAGPVGIGAFPPPPSVLLAPAKPYKGSPIGTLYDLRIYASERPEERPPRRNTIRLALRAVQTPPQQVTLDLQGSIESRPTILSRGKIKLHCELNTNAVRYGETLEVKLSVQNNSRSSIRRILVVSLIQQVDVCMFTSGKFKNIVGYAEDNILLVPGASYQKRYNLTPQRGPARQWLALEEAFGREPVLAPSTVTDGLEPAVDIGPQKGGSNNRSRNVFAIIVSYYVKAKLILGGLSLCQSLKVPFVLLPPLNSDDPDPYPGGTSTTADGDGGGGINYNPESIIATTHEGGGGGDGGGGGVGEGGGDTVDTKGHSPRKLTSADKEGDGGVYLGGPTVGGGSVSRGGTCDNSDTQRTGGQVSSSTNKSRIPSSSGGGGGTTSSSSHSTSSTGGGMATLHHHQPQIHHHHLATSPATTPSPVKIPSVEHLF